MPVKDSARHVHVVVRNDDRLFQRSIRESSAGRYRRGVVVFAAGGRVDAQADHHRIVGAVVAALHLGDFAAPGERPRGPNRVQSGLGAGVGEAHLIE